MAAFKVTIAYYNGFDTPSQDCKIGGGRDKGGDRSGWGWARSQSQADGDSMVNRLIRWEALGL